MSLAQATRSPVSNGHRDSVQAAVDPLPADAAPAVRPAAQQIYEQFRRQIEHEDNLISQRSSWVLMAQSFLVVGYCIMHQNAPPDPAVQPLYWMITNGIAYLAFIALVPILLGIIASLRAMRALDRRFADIRREVGELDELLGSLPPLHGREPNCVFGQLASLLLPLVFLVFWSTMLVAQSLHST